MQEMTVDSIRVSLMNYQRVVILKEMESDRHLPIWIGPAEADAIAVKLQGISVPRPLTHDLLQSVIDNLGAEISYIRINDLKNDTFFAKIGVSMNGKKVEVDSRPSDAIALAVTGAGPHLRGRQRFGKGGDSARRGHGPSDFQGGLVLGGRGQAYEGEGRGAAEDVRLYRLHQHAGPGGHRPGRGEGEARGEGHCHGELRRVSEPERSC